MKNLIYYARHIIIFSGLFLAHPIAFSQTTLNILAWGGEINPAMIHRFSKEHDISVNVITFDSNEAMNAKLKLSAQFDMVLSSSYFIARLAKEGHIDNLSPQKIPNLNTITPYFLHSANSKKKFTNIPYYWGATGLFYNQQFSSGKLTHWHELWQPRFKNKLMLLDDSREAFSIALLSLGFNPNDDDLSHIEKAYEKLKALGPNIKFFGTNAIQAAIIDEDINQGVVWNGDAYKAALENKNIQFTFPTDGFVMWVDSFALLKRSKQKNAAYTFINFMLDDKIAANNARYSGYTPTSERAINKLPRTQKENSIFNPGPKVIQQGTLQKDLSPKARARIQFLWEKLKTEI